MKLPIHQLLTFSPAFWDSEMETDTGALVKPTRNIRVISHNLRGVFYGPFYPHEYPWSPKYGKADFYRRPYSSKQLQEYAKLSNDSDVFICFQEAHYDQVVDLVGDLNGGKFKTISSQYYKYMPPEYNGVLGRTEYIYDPANPDALGDVYEGGEWSYVGVGRDDGDKIGESSSILYQPSKWRVITWRTLWLAANTTGPGTGGGFGRGNRREATTAIFESKDADKTRVVVMNTHLDDSYWYDNDEPRKQELLLIGKSMDIYTGRDKLAGYNYPLILGGDFNADPTAPSIKDFVQTKTQLWPPRKTATNYDLHQNLRAMVPSQAWGPVNAYTTFGTEYYPDNIDYIWCTPWSDDGGKNVYGRGKHTGRAYWSITPKTQFGVVDNMDKETGVLNSDHDLIYVDIVLNC